MDAAITWLLTAETPAIRYRALVDLLGRAPDDPEVAAARSDIMARGPVPAILARQAERGSWAGERSFYTPKYTSSHWSLLLLTELSVDAAHPGFQRGVQYVLDATGEALCRRLAGDLGWSCLWGNMLRYALHAGRHGDPETDALIGFAVRDLQAGPCVCEHNEGYPCAWGVARLLWGLADLPTGQRTSAIRQAIERGVAFLLEDGRLADAAYPGPAGRQIHPLWFDLNFPLFYQADILFALRVLAELEVLDRPGAAPALTWLATRCREGRWRGCNPYGNRTWPDLRSRAETNRWVTLQAQRILMRAPRHRLLAGA